MQTCSLCSTQSPDAVQVCPTCQADLREFSTTAAALQRFQKNPRVKIIHLSVAGDACPACRAVQGVYEKDLAPHLPVEGCSHANGCRCFYEPVLDEIFP